MATIGDRLVETMQALGQACEALTFEPPVAYVYNPLVYAWAPYADYLHRYAHSGIEAVLVGMNPGPFGMLQTGIPFGDVGVVRDWLGIEGVVEPPPRQHPKRPVQGFAIRRGEVSGRRVWGWARERFQTPERFFAHFFVINYCPLGLFDASGANLTPDALRGAQRDALYAVCDQALSDVLCLLQPKAAIGVGRFAEQRLQAVVPALNIRAMGVTHPSPANPRSHGGWGPHMDAVAAELGLSTPEK
ncbi:MAG TPA: uracil-DNA glycosylase family protein [Gammaproteobacteria bacterium]|nr:uracil-DNA glycosylase family protein [Gammaproteobacteria bacterium]